MGSCSSYQGQTIDQKETQIQAQRPDEIICSNINKEKQFEDFSERLHSLEQDRLYYLQKSWSRNQQQKPQDNIEILGREQQENKQTIELGITNVAFYAQSQQNSQLEPYRRERITISSQFVSSSKNNGHQISNDLQQQMIIRQNSIQVFTKPCQKCDQIIKMLMYPYIGDQSNQQSISSTIKEAPCQFQYHDKLMECSQRLADRNHQAQIYGSYISQQNQDKEITQLGQLSKQSGKCQ